MAGRLNVPQYFERFAMNPPAWKMILALAIGSGIGIGLRRGLASVFGRSGSAISVSTVTASSILGGFCGAAVGWIMSSPALAQDVQTLLMFGILGVMATVAADAVAAQASMSANDLARVRRRALVHVAVGIAAALIGIALVTGAVHLANS
jgi:fluoride ion exporter CrcB/FEX